MGEDKALLPFSKFKTLTEFQLSRLSKIFKNVYISCKDKNKFDFEASFIEDIKTDSVFAPTVGFISAFKELNNESFFALSVDTPFIGEVEIRKIIEQDSSNISATVAKSVSGIHPICGIYHRSLEGEFIKMLEGNNHKLGLLLKNSNTTFVSFEDDEVFLNLNNPEEYKKALTLV